jgi:hypothetical protein
MFLDMLFHGRAHTWRSRALTLCAIAHNLPDLCGHFYPAQRAGARRYLHTTKRKNIMSIEVMVYEKVSCDVFKEGIIPFLKTSQDNHKTFLRRFYRN